MFVIVVVVFPALMTASMMMTASPVVASHGACSSLMPPLAQAPSGVTGVD